MTAPVALKPGFQRGQQLVASFGGKLLWVVPGALHVFNVRRRTFRGRQSFRLPTAHLQRILALFHITVQTFSTLWQLLKKRRRIVRGRPRPPAPRLSFPKGTLRT